MKNTLLIFLFFLITFKVKAQVEEYVGGRDFTIWITLKLNPNGKYEYHYGTHSFASIEDKGTWELKGNFIILNSFKKVKNKYRGKEVGKAKYLFCDFKYRIIKGNLIVNKRSKRASKGIINFDLIKFKNE